jgi:DNA-binding GntR family transcriptional regulator
MQEFGVSRPTVVAALRELREQGWIESQQGKGRFVRVLRRKMTQHQLSVEKAMYIPSVP